MDCVSHFKGWANDDCCKKHVQDKVCLTGKRTLFLRESVMSNEQIYFSNTRITATGFFKILSVPSPTAVVTLQFLLNNTVLAIPSIIDPLGAFESVAFTVLNFDEIRISSSVAGTIEFELSLTPRYFL
jgi:hypothetical protein